VNQEHQNTNRDFIQEFFENFDIKFLLYVAKKSLVFIVLLLVLSIFIPYLYLRYTTPIFETTAALIKKKENTNVLLEGKETELLKPNEEDKINRDIQIIKSDFLVTRLMDSLNLRVQYYKKGRMFYKRFEVNVRDYFEVAESSAIYNKALINSEIEIEFHDKNSYDLLYTLGGRTIKVKDLKTDKLYFNEDLKIKITKVNPKIEGDYIIVFNSDEHIRNYMLTQIQVTNANSNIFFSIKSANPNQSKFLLQKLINGFLIQDQNENAERLENSIRYIKDYLDTVKDQVKISQTEKLNYVKSNRMYEPTLQLESSLEEIEAYKKIIEDQEVKLNLLERIKREVNSHALHSLETIQQGEDKDLLLLIKERNKLLIDYKPTHPTIALLDKQIQDKVRIAQNAINHQIDESNQKLSIFRSRQHHAFSSVSDLPEKTMELSKIQKELDIKEKYVFDLIEKQIQYLIMKSSIGADYLLIQPPTTKEEQIYPRKGLAYTAGFIVFLFSSILIILTRYIRFDKVISINEIKRKTHVPILGYVPFVPEATDKEMLKKNSPISRLVVLSHFKSRVSEVFKKMRASMKYTSAGDYKTICSTSTIPGEGKTFILINLAAVHALLDKKVLIIDLDLRKPRISKSFKIPNSKGMSNLLTDKSILLDDCIQKGIDIENLDVITSGPIPPNPSELITSSRFEEILNELKTRYDYIFIDTPPIGLVNESIEIVNKVDISLYLVKMNHSHKDFVQMLNETDKLKKNTNLFLIVNHYGDGPSSYVNSSYGYGYGYGYGATYGDTESDAYGYYTDSTILKKPELVKRIFNYFDWKL